MPTPTYDGVVTSELNENEEDKRLLVQFYMEAVKNEAKSAEAGRPIFDEQPCIRIVTPGSRDVMVTTATERYQQRFPRQWAQFTKQQEQAVEGTPLEQVPFLTVGQIAELKAVNCLTLEHLASMSDQLASKMMGMNSLRQKAQAYLDAAKNAAPMTQLHAELEQRDNEIGTLKKQLEMLQAQMAKLAKKD